MKIANIPAKFPIPFAESAGGSYIRSIPVSSQIGITNGAASLADGFVPLNFLPVGSGGVPPFGQDMNGILNQITLWSQWQGAGGLPIYDSSFSTSIGGYPQGSILSSGTTAGVVWLSTTDDNTSNPDAGGANWLSFAMASSSRLRLIATRVFNTVGTTTYTPSVGTVAVDVECQGGGGPGAGAPSTSSGQVSVGAPGSGGSYGRGFYTSGFSGVTITVGAGGDPASGAVGTAGAPSSFGSLLVAQGGSTTQVVIAAPPTGAAGAQGTLATGGYINGSGTPGTVSLALNLAIGGFGGSGGPGHWGGGGTGVANNTNGIAGNAPGAGGSGTSNIQSSPALTGGAGASGIVIVREYGQ